MKYKYQVMVCDSRDYILHHDDFSLKKIADMLKYIHFHATRDDVRKITITRWKVDD